MTALLDSPGVIRPDEVYTKDEFCRRTGMKAHAYRTAKRKGLRVISTAGRVFVRGADWLSYLDVVSREDATGEVEFI